MFSFFRDYKNSLGWKLTKLVSDFKFVPYKLNRHSKYEVGHTYWNCYLERYYIVVEIIDESKIKAKWEDGKFVIINSPLDIANEYELMRFKSRDGVKIENAKYSYSFAEIKALMFNNIIDKNVALAINEQYLSNDHLPNDYTCFYLRVIKNEGKTKIRLKRDMRKSPHNFYNIKTVGDLLKDTRIALYEFVDSDGNKLEVEPSTIAESAKVLKIKYITGAKYEITIDAKQRCGGHIFYNKEDTCYACE